MSGIGRGIAALLLAGAVAGAAAFAHQLGNEAAPPALRTAGMPASHAQPPLVVVAAPAPPLLLPQRAARPSHYSPVPRPAIRPVAAPPAPATAPAPPNASATAAPAPAAPVPPPEPAAPVAAPAPPAPADRALATAASVPAQSNEHVHGKAKGHDKGRKDHKNSGGDTPVGLAATPPETPVPSGTETDEAAVPGVPEAQTQVESSDRHGPDDRGNKHDGNGEHGNDVGD